MPTVEGAAVSLGSGTSVSVAQSKSQVAQERSGGASGCHRPLVPSSTRGGRRPGCSEWMRARSGGLSSGREASRWRRLLTPCCSGPTGPYLVPPVRGYVTPAGGRTLRWSDVRVRATRCRSAIGGGGYCAAPHLPCTSPVQSRAIVTTFLVVGMPKSGTSAIYSAIKQELPGGCRVFEVTNARQIDFFAHRAETQDVIAKILLPRVFDMDVDFSMWDRVVHVVRDPRDIVVSWLLYRPFLHGNYRNSEFVKSFLAALEEKEADPGSWPMVRLHELIHSFGIGHWSPGRYENLFRQEHELPARVGDHFSIRYEDFLDGDVEGVSDFLGLPIRNKTSVGLHSAYNERRKAYGDWKNWFTPEDVDVFRPLFDAYLDSRGYDSSWELPRVQSIDPSTASGHVRRFVETLQTNPDSVGSLLDEAHYDDRRLQVLRSGVEDGREPHMIELALASRDGIGAVQRDHALMRHLLEEAAQRGNPLAMVHLALAYRHGVGVEADRLRAQELIDEAVAVRNNRRIKAMLTEYTPEWAPAHENDANRRPDAGPSQATETAAKRIIILGNGRTGSTGVYNSIKTGLMEASPGVQPLCVSEPSISVASALARYGKEEPLVLVKAMINKTGTRLKTDFYTHKVLIVRDPRDALISQLLYYPLQAYGFRRTDDRQFAEYIELIRQKERSPGSVSFRTLFEHAVHSMEWQPDWTWDSYFQRYLDTLTYLDDDPFVLKYEDFVEGRLEDLSKHVGFAVQNTRVESTSRTGHVMRSLGYGDWRHWFTSEDVSFFRPYVEEYLKAFDYEDDWRLASEQSIDPATASTYVLEKRRKVGKTFSTRFEDATTWSPADLEDDQALQRMHEAAEDGGIGDLYRLATLYRSGGAGVEPDPALAFSFARRGAILGSLPCMALLAEMLRSGTGCRKDEDAAWRWMREAYRVSRRRAASLSDQLTKANNRLRTAQRAADEERVRKFGNGAGVALSRRRLVASARRVVRRLRRLAARWRD